MSIDATAADYDVTMAKKGAQVARSDLIPTLTGVRAFAAFLVLALHASQNFPNSLSDLAIVQNGYLGVDLFFILSGFIITHVYASHMASLNLKALQIFLWHRLIRLFPAHAVVLILLVVIIAGARSFNIHLNDPEKWDYSVLPWHFLMMHAWGTTSVSGWNAPSWSISAEWFAYLIFPLALAGALILPKRAVLPTAFFVLILSAVIFHVEGWRIKSAWIGISALVRVTSEFFCGILIYRASRIDRHGLAPPVSDALTFGSLILLCVGTVLRLSDFGLIFLLAILILGVSGPGSGVRTLFGNRLVIWLGEISYSIYVVHFTVLLILRHGSERMLHHKLLDSQPASIGMFLVSLATTVIAAAILYYTVENPIRRRLRNAAGKFSAQ